jgi:Tfp pilus assembly protein PilF
MASASDPKAHDEARNLVEDALEKLNQDKPDDAKKLIDKAQKIDPSAAEEVVADLDEDASSDHTPTAR